MACWQGGPGGHGPPSEDFLGGAKTQRGHQNWSKALVKTFVTIRETESDEPMKEKWTEFYRDLRSVWQCLCLCVCHTHTTLTTTATPCARATFPNSVVLTDQLTSWFLICQIFRQFGPTHDQITYCRNHSLMCLCAYFAWYFFSVFSNCSKDVKLWIANCETDYVKGVCLRSLVSVLIISCKDISFVFCKCKTLSHCRRVAVLTCKNHSINFVEWIEINIASCEWPHSAETLISAKSAKTDIIANSDYQGPWARWPR